MTKYSMHWQAIIAAIWQMSKYSMHWHAIFAIRVDVLKASFSPDLRTVSDCSLFFFVTSPLLFFLFSFSSCSMLISFHFFHFSRSTKEWLNLCLKLSRPKRTFSFLSDEQGLQLNSDTTTNIEQQVQSTLTELQSSTHGTNNVNEYNHLRNATTELQTSMPFFEQKRNSTRGWNT